MAANDLGLLYLDGEGVE